MFHLTRQERAVLIALSFILLAGISLRYTFCRYPFLANAVNRLDEKTLYPKLDINKACYQELVRIPSVGPVTAKRILLYRQEHRAFQSLAELKMIRGISKKKYKTLKQFFKPLP